MVAQSAQVGGAIVGTQRAVATIEAVGCEQEGEGSHLGRFGQKVQMARWGGRGLRAVQQGAAGQEMVDELPMDLVLVAALDGAE